MLYFYLFVQVVSPSGTEDDCFIQSIDQDEYSVRFMPRDNGVHNIHVKFNGVHIPGSPYRLKVGKGDADPAAVHASGPGLGDVKTGNICLLIRCNLLTFIVSIRLYYIIFRNVFKKKNRWYMF